ncbi:hypothetical protein [Winslowiella iniecta]|uniref:Uncharacterized protein n=1 Tax=Winslowiella iniecta TaxID=1560201 RepID=A0A0L7TIV2_9GAMM|nr:hypothetical protein [Winslowiella iniecta]KOC92809.1 hypothetical protein NG42_00420 [Winslowiella iniecta]KOC95270.1 hypothetical protein NG43_00750 [Winslowiella iniecta]
MTNSKNTKKTSGRIASVAAQTLKNPDATAMQKSLAGSALAQSRTDKESGKEMEGKASSALTDPESDALTRSLAASVLSQSNKIR